MDDAALEAFGRAVSLPEPELDLGRAALLFARAEYPHLNVEHYLDRLDAMAGSLRAEMALEGEPLRRVALLNRFLFVTEGFRGNAEQYYDPRNSFLNEVLDRKLGIPISLSAVYMELAWRLDMPVVGVGFPGHFLVKYLHGEPGIIIDPFHRGAVLSEADCRRRLEAMSEGGVTLRPEHLRPVTKRQIVARMLANLKQLYLRARDFPKAVRIIDLMLAASPGDAGEMRDRGLVLIQAGRLGAAVRDLERYLASAPEAEDAKKLKEHLEGVRRRIASMN
jgi:regulator of sirC expression with transglutaminase-like and TPR domain